MNRLDHLLVLTLAVYGLCYILMYGSLFNKPRNFLMRRFGWFRRLITCPLCTGFWCGLAFSPFHLTPMQTSNTEWWGPLTMVFPFACYSAIMCYVFHLVTEILIAKAYPSIEKARCPQDEEGIDNSDYII